MLHLREGALGVLNRDLKGQVKGMPLPEQMRKLSLVDRKYLIF